MEQEREQAIALVRKGARQFTDLSEELRSDREVVMEAVQKNGYLLE